MSVTLHLARQMRLGSVPCNPSALYTSALHEAGPANPDLAPSDLYAHAMLHAGMIERVDGRPECSICGEAIITKAEA